jgi:hypothetical protein
MVDLFIQQFLVEVAIDGEKKIVDPAIEDER